MGAQHDRHACDTCVHLSRRKQAEGHYYACAAPITYPANVLFGGPCAPDPANVSRWITVKLVDEHPERLRHCPLWTPTLETPPCP